MKKIKLIALTIIVLSMQSCSPKQSYPDIDSGTLKKDFYWNNGYGEPVKVNYTDIQDTLITQIVFNRMLRKAMSESKASLNNPLSFVPASIVVTNSAPPDSVTYTFMVSMRGKNAYGTEYKAGFRATFTQEGEYVELLSIPLN